MKVLIIGSGGREHAIAVSLKKNKKITELFALPGNGGIAAVAECVDIKVMDFDKILDFIKSHAIDFVVIGPDDPLVGGLADLLIQHGVRVFGPTKNAAKLEGSKVFSKLFMKKYNIPTANFEIFSDYNLAVSYIRKKGAPIVIKADGLALGKGVVVAKTVDEAVLAVKEIMLDKIFGDSGKKVLIEECLYGREISVLAFCDGKTIKPMISAQDHKRINDDDMGPNTGGMGTFAPSPIYTDEIEKECYEKIFIPTLNGLKMEEILFKGIIFFGLMVTEKGVMVIEYNARFGDPETQVVLPLLETDLFDIFNAVVNQKLDEIEIKWSKENAVCVVMASGGYPKKYQTGYEIDGIENCGCDVFHAGTKIDNGRILTAGGRVLGVTAIGKDMETARDKAYDGVRKISFTNVHYRTDIGKK